MEGSNVLFRIGSTASSVLVDDAAPNLSAGVENENAPQQFSATANQTDLINIRLHQNVEDESMLVEARRVLRLATPLAITNLCSFGISLVTVAFVGRLGSFQLAVSILATSFFNVSGMSLLQGFNAALETFCGQAYGAANYRGVGIALQRALLLNLILCTVVMLGWVFAAEKCLLALGQDPDISAASARYLALLSPALVFAALFEALKRYHTVQNDTHAVTLATTVSLLVAPLYNYFLITNYGLDGAALAVVAVEFTMSGYLVIHSILKAHKQTKAGDVQRTWQGWSPLEAVSGSGEYLYIALLSVITICAEWWSFEMIILMAGWLNHPQVTVAVIGIVMNLSAMIWMVISGLGLACSARVSVSLGGGLPKAARRATIVSLIMGIGGELVAGGLILLTRNYVARLFTNVPEVVSLTASLMPLLALSLVGDGASACLQGLLRGSGRQGIGAITNLCSYWVLGLPVAYTLAFRANLGLEGLVWGMVIINTFQGLVMSVVASIMDFDTLSEEAITRSSADGGGGSLVEPLLVDVDIEAENRDDE